MRTPRSTFPKGFFSEIDSIHLHVDGGVAVELVESVVEWLNREGHPSKLTSIEDAIAGPQRKDLPPTYQSHTPGIGDQENLEYFSTTLFRDYDQAKQQLKRLLKEFAAQKGIVIEAERVIGKIDQDFRWSKMPLREVPIIHSAEVGFERSNTLPVEIHYGCDIPKKRGLSETPPLGLETLLDVCAELEIRVGGWFLFEEVNTWCYRSNMFEGNALPERVKKQRDDLAEHLTRIGGELGVECEVTALVERSLGVWKTPLTPWTPPRRTAEFKEREELAKWEENYQNLESFWVVAGNFLGDLRDEVFQAMVQNLRRGVEYTYFLRSYADFQRLRQLAKSLSNKVPFAQEYINAILLRTNGLQSETGSFQGEYFIANPHLTSAQAYKLVRAEDKQIKGGRLIKSTEIGRLTTELRTLIHPTNEVQGWSMPIQETQRPVARAVVYTDLKGSITFQEQSGDANWECALLEYDLIVANQMSRLQGEVVKNLGDGYLLVFEQAGDALLCAQGLQTAIRSHNVGIASDSERLRIPPHRIALDFGFVTRVMRSHGPDYTGKTLSRCARLIQIAREDDILMLNTFRDSVKAAFPYAWITEKTKSKGKIVFKGLEDEHEIWEFLWTD